MPVKYIIVFSQGDIIDRYLKQNFMIKNILAFSEKHYYTVF